MDEIKNLCICTSSTFNTEKILFKEITLYNSYVKMHWTVILPVSHEELSSMEKLNVEFCTKYLHNLDFQNQEYNFTLAEIKSYITKFCKQLPGAVFAVKGDLPLKSFLVEECGVKTCFDLNQFGCPKYMLPSDKNNECYSFCTLHARVKCSYNIAVRYYYWKLQNY